MALVIVFLARSLRTLSWVKKQMLADKKPWVCDLCTSFWLSLALVSTGYVSGALDHDWRLFVILAGSSGAGSMMLTLAGDRPAPPLPE